MNKAAMIFFINIAFSLTVIVSPEVQTFLGNGLGLGGGAVLLSLLLVGALQLLTIHAYGSLSFHGEGETSVLATITGQPLSLFFPLSGRFLFFLFAATNLLATAGFVFNEIFLYWFPNFGFAFLLLACLVAVNLIGSRFSSFLQLILVSLTLVCLVLLLIVGVGQEIDVKAGEPAYQFRGYLLPFCMLLGVELFIFSPYSATGVHRSAVAGVVFAVFLLLCWGMTMLNTIPFEKLADSFSPHLRTARTLWGQPGRIVAGVMIICGAGAVVNGLLLTLTRQVGALAEDGIIPRLFALGKPRFPLTLILLALGPVAMMLFGMAGEDITDVFIRSTIILWLFGYCVFHIAVAQKYDQNKILHIAASLLTCGGVIGLIMTDPEFILLCKSIVVFSLAAGVISVVLYLTSYQKKE